jgi:hypothetical protein
LSAPVIEPEPPAAPPLAIAPEPAKEEEASPTVTSPLPQADFQPAATIETKAETKIETKSDLKPEIKAEPIIPLVHAPDDPGPDLPEEIETPAAPESGWRKIFG